MKLIELEWGISLFICTHFSSYAICLHYAICRAEPPWKKVAKKPSVNHIGSSDEPPMKIPWLGVSKMFCVQESYEQDVYEEVICDTFPKNTMRKLVAVIADNAAQKQEIYEKCVKFHVESTNESPRNGIQDVLWVKS